MSFEGWVHDDGCVICPHCNAFITCEPDIPAILAAASGHVCEARQRGLFTAGAVLI